MSGAHLMGYRVYFEPDRADEALELIEGLMLAVGIYWDLEEIG